MLKNTIIKLFKQGHSRNLKTLLEKIHPVDLALILPSLDAENKKALFEHYVTDKQAARIISKLRDKKTVSAVLSGIKRRSISEIFKHINPDDTAYLLSMLPIEESESLLKLIKKTDAEEVNKVLKFNQDISGGIMNTSYLFVPVNSTVENCIKEIHKTKDKNDSLYIYIVDVEGAVKGKIPLKDLFRWPLETKVSDIMDNDPVYLPWNASPSKITNTAYRYGVPEIPVIDGNKRLIGVISIGNIFKTAKKETAYKLLKNNGLIDIKEPTKINTFNSIKIKFPILIYMAALGFLSSVAINYYLDIKGPHSVIISFIPLVLVTAYILSTGSAAILLRELFFERINAADTSSFMVVLAEVMSGTFYGIVLASASILYTLSLLTKNIKMAILCAIGILLSSIIASFLGAHLNVLTVRAGIKPTRVPLPLIIGFTVVACLVAYLWITNYLYYTNVVPDSWKILKF